MLRRLVLLPFLNFGRCDHSGRDLWFGRGYSIARNNGGEDLGFHSWMIECWPNVFRHQDTIWSFRTVPPSSNDIVLNNLVDICPMIHINEPWRDLAETTFVMSSQTQALNDWPKTAHFKYVSRDQMYIYQETLAIRLGDNSRVEHRNYESMERLFKDRTADDIGLWTGTRIRHQDKSETTLSSHIEQHGTLINRFVSRDPKLSTEVIQSEHYKCLRQQLLSVPCHTRWRSPANHSRQRNLWCTGEAWYLLFKNWLSSAAF